MDSCPLAGALSGVAAGGAGGAGGVACAAEVTSFVSSVVALRNSRIALPTAPPSSGSRPGPKMIKTTTRMTINHSGWNGMWPDYMLPDACDRLIQVTPTWMVIEMILSAGAVSLWARSMPLITVPNRL